MKDGFYTSFDPKHGVMKLEASPQKKWFDFNFNLFRRNQELSITPMFKADSAIIYSDTGRDPKMWDIKTPMPVAGDTQILAHIKLK